MKFFLLVIFLSFTSHSIANNVDSLLVEYEALKHHGNDSVLYDLCRNISFHSKKPDLQVDFAKLAYEHAANMEKTIKKAASRVLQSYPSVNAGNLDEVIYFLLDAKRLYSEAVFLKGVATCKLICL